MSLEQTPTFFDIETNGLLKSQIGPTNQHGGEQGSAEPVDRIHCICTGHLGSELGRFNAQPHGDSISAGLNRLEEAELLVGHNIIGYDIPVIKHLYPQWSTKATIVDTFVMSMFAYPDLKQLDWANTSKVPRELKGRHSLESWGYRLGILKGDYAKKENAWAKWSQEMEDYCVQDVAVTEALFNHLSERIGDKERFALMMEHELQATICHQERHGFLFDIPAAQDLYATLCEKREPLAAVLQETFPPIPPRCLGVYGNQKKRMEREFPELDWTDPSDRGAMEFMGIKFKWTKEKPFNPNSEQQIIERFTALGWKPQVFTDKGQACVNEEILVELAKTYPQAEPLAENAMLTKRLSQLSEGDSAWLKLVGDDSRIHGRCKTMGTITHRFTHFTPNVAQVPAVGVPYGEECRSLFMVPDDCDLVGCDADGLELRMLGHYMAPRDGGAYANEVMHGDIHTLNQQAVGLDTRPQAKKFIYAFLYGAGDGLLGSIVGGGVREGKAMKRRFFRQLPALKSLIDAVRKQATKYKRIRALDGRRLPVRSAHSALNTLLQSAGSILVKHATVMFARDLKEHGLIEGLDWSLVAHIHDEWQTECLKEHTSYVEAAGPRAIAAAGKRLNLKVETTGSAKVGRTWADTH